MYSVSARFLDTLRQSHGVRIKAEILVDGAVAQEIQGVTTVDAAGSRTATLGGSVKVQRNLIRRACSVNFLNLDATLTPTDSLDLFSLLRNEIRLYRGVQYWDATQAEIQAGTDVEYCPIGTFIIGKVSGTYPTLAIEGYDRLWDLRGRFEKPYVIPNNSDTVAEIQRLLQFKIPANRQSFNLPDLGFTTALTVKLHEEDPGALLADLAASCGYVAYADPMGTVQMAADPDIVPGNIAWSFIPGTTNIAKRPVREIDATEAYNVVIATGETNDGTTAPARGEAIDDNPASLTYVGAVGRNPFFYSSPLFSKAGQAQQAANTILKSRLGVSDTLVVSAVPNPALDISDLLYAEDIQQDLARMFLPDSFSVGLSASAEQSINGRTQVLT